MAIGRTEDLLKAAIQTAMEQCIRDAREETIKAAVKNFEAEVRRTIGVSALEILNCYNVQRMGNEIVIHVKIEGAQ